MYLHPRAPMLHIELKSSIAYRYSTNSESTFEEMLIIDMVILICLAIYIVEVLSFLSLKKLDLGLLDT